jgi:hypothetical protein
MKYLADYFDERIRAFDVKTELNLSSLEYDLSPQAASNSQNAVSNIDQIYNGLKLTNKWLLLDGYNSLDGSYKILPSTKDDKLEVGYMSAEVADATGAFATFPYIELSFTKRPIQTINIVFDTQKNEYAVDFDIEFYDENGALLHTENITGNNSAIFHYTMTSAVPDVATIKYIFKTWNKPNTVAKVSELETIMLLTFNNERILGANYREKLYSQTGLYGVIAREIDINLADHDNYFSNYKEYLRPNRNLRAYIRPKGHDFAKPTFSRNSAAYNADGWLCEVNEPRWDKVKNRRGLLIEEGTTNLFSNPIFADGTFNGYNLVNLLGWTTKEIKDGGPFGKYAELYTANGSAGIGAWININEGETYSFTVYVKVLEWDQRSNGQVEIVYFDANNTVLSFANKKFVEIPSTNRAKDWTRFNVVLTAPAGATKARVIIWIGATTIKLQTTGFQFEKKPYATTLANTTRENEIVSIPENLFNKNFTVEMLVKTDNLHNNGYLFYQKATSEIYGKLNNGIVEFNYMGNIITGTTNIADDNIHYVAFTYNSGTLKLYVDGNKEAETTITPPTPETPTTDVILGSNGTTDFLNGYIISWHLANVLDDNVITEHGLSKVIKHDINTIYLFDYQEYCSQTWIPLGEYFTERFTFKKNVLNVYAKDLWKFLFQRNFFDELQQNQNVYTILENVLDDAGINSQKRDLDTDLQNITLPYVFLNDQHAKIIQNLAEIAGYYAYFDRWDYLFKVSKRGELLGETTVVLDESEDKSLLANYVETSFSIFDEANNLSPKTQQWIFDIDVGTTRMRLNFDKFLTNASINVNSAPSGATVNVLKTDIAGVEIEIVSPTAGTVDISVNGYELAIVKSNIVLEDTLSISNYGLSAAKLNYTYVANAPDLAQNLASQVLSAFSEPEKALILKSIGNPYFEVGHKIRYNNNEYVLLENIVYFKGGMTGRLRGRRE